MDATEKKLLDNKRKLAQLEKLKQQLESEIAAGDEDDTTQAPPPRPAAQPQPAKKRQSPPTSQPAPAQKTATSAAASGGQAQSPASPSTSQPAPAAPKKPIQRPAARPAPHPATATAAASTAAPVAAATVTATNQNQQSEEHETDDDYEEEAAPRGRWMAIKSVPPWLVSLLVHLVALVVLALYTFSVMQEETKQIVIASAIDEQESELEELAEVEVKIEEVEVQEITHQSVDAVDPGAVNFADVAAAVENAQTAGLDAAQPLQTTIGEIGDLFGTRGSGMADIGEGLKGAGTFFGQKAQGNKFVFVVDNSLSMNNGRFVTALNEMTKSIAKMSPKQQFYIIFFSDTAYPMFHPNPAPGLVPATELNKEKVHAWLYGVERCLKTKGELALQKALQLRPDVIYILGDGAFTDKTADFICAPHNRRTIIHTFGMEVKEKGRTELTRIAKFNRGNFSGVQPTPASKNEGRNIKNNRNRGPIWGIDLPPGNK